MLLLKCVLLSSCPPVLLSSCPPVIQARRTAGAHPSSRRRHSQRRTRGRSLGPSEGAHASQPSMRVHREHVPCDDRPRHLAAAIQARAASSTNPQLNRGRAKRTSTGAQKKARSSCWWQSVPHTVRNKKYASLRRPRPLSKVAKGREKRAARPLEDLNLCSQCETDAVLPGAGNSNLSP